MNNYKWADLHIHTNKSDSTSSITDVFANAAREQIDAIAITDHDTVAAMEEAEKLAEKGGIEFVPGIEISAMLDNREVHIVGLFIDWKDKGFHDKLAYFQAKRMERAEKIINKLKQMNMSLEFSELFEFTQNINNVGRLHIARLLVYRRYADNIRDAFDKYLSEERPAYVEKARISVEEGIALIKSVKGVAILAHPGKLKMDDLIGKWHAAGLDGVEAFHPDHNYGDTGRYMEIAQKYGMLISGGSDCHGMGKDNTKIGKVKLPYSYFEKIRNFRFTKAF